MDQESSLDFSVQECLKRLDISSPADWDVLVFVYRDKVTLANAEQIARMLGYPNTTAGDALDHLESLRLIQRSRASQGARIYQFVSSRVTPAACNCLRQLIALAENPAGRLLLIRTLRQRGNKLSPAMHPVSLLFNTGSRGNCRASSS